MGKQWANMYFSSGNQSWKAIIHDNFWNHNKQWNSLIKHKSNDTIRSFLPTNEIKLTLAKNRRPKIKLAKQPNFRGLLQHPKLYYILKLGWSMHSYALVADWFLLIYSHCVDGFSWSILSMIAQLITLFHKYIQALDPNWPWDFCSYCNARYICALPSVLYPWTHTHSYVYSVWTWSSLLLVIYIYLFKYVLCHIICSVYSCVSSCLCFTVYAWVSCLFVIHIYLSIYKCSCHATCFRSKAYV